MFDKIRNKTKMFSFNLKTHEQDQTIYNIKHFIVIFNF